MFYHEALIGGLLITNHGRLSVVLREITTISRFLDQDSHVAVMKQTLLFLEGMDSFTMAGEPVFSDDDHRVTFPVRTLGHLLFFLCHQQQESSARQRAPSESCPAGLGFFQYFLSTLYSLMFLSWLKAVLSGSQCVRPFPLRHCTSVAGRISPLVRRYYQSSSIRGLTGKASCARRLDSFVYSCPVVFER